MSFLQIILLIVVALVGLYLVGLAIVLSIIALPGLFVRRPRPAAPCPGCNHPWYDHGFEPGCTHFMSDGSYCGCMLRPKPGDVAPPK